MGKQVKDYNELLINLGKRITAFRKAKGMTQAELAFRCDFEDPNMNRIEKGKTNPTFLTLEKICRELDVDISTLLKDL